VSFRSASAKWPTILRTGESRSPELLAERPVESGLSPRSGHQPYGKTAYGKPRDAGVEHELPCGLVRLEEVLRKGRRGIDQGLPQRVDLVGRATPGFDAIRTAGDRGARLADATSAPMFLRMVLTRSTPGAMRNGTGAYALCCRVRNHSLIARRNASSRRCT